MDDATTTTQTTAETAAALAAEAKLLVPPTAANKPLRDAKEASDLKNALAVSDPVNFRDLGGISVDGGTVVSGLVYRSDDICLVPTAWAENLVDTLTVTSILDLRSESELRTTGRGPLADFPVAYHHYPFGGDVVVEGAASIVEPEQLSAWYAQLLAASAPMIVSALALISVERGATVFHCSAGKDRTGILAASLLAVLGASDATIAADYGRTGDVMDSLVTRLAASHGISPTDSRIRGFLTMTPRPAVLTADAPVMAAALQLVAAEHGSLVQLLRQNGLTDDLVAALRAKLVVVT